MMDITDAINALHPENSYVLRDDDYSKIEWVNAPENPATLEQVNAKLAELQADYDSKSYARARQKNFPNEHDLLIALWEKVMEDRSESADALQAIRTQVKSDNPKP